VLLSWPVFFHVRRSAVNFVHGRYFMRTRSFPATYQEGLGIGVGGKEIGWCLVGQVLRAWHWPERRIASPGNERECCDGGP